MLLPARFGRVPVSEWRVKFSKFSVRAFLHSLFLLNSHSENQTVKELKDVRRKSFASAAQIFEYL